MNAFTGVRVFSATMVAQRERLGDQVTEWLLSMPHIDVVDVAITQSSDAKFHCIAITVFYRDRVDEPEKLVFMEDVRPPRKRLTFKDDPR